VSDWYPVTFYPELDELTETFARFTANKMAGDYFEVILPRKQWEAMGRPGKVYYEPKPWPIEVTVVAASSNKETHA